MKLHMKLLSLAFVSSAATAELHFRPLPASARRALLSVDDLTGHWEQAVLDETGQLCFESIPDRDKRKKRKKKRSTDDDATVRYAPCDNTRAAQMWKFDHSDGGSYYNSDGGYDGGVAIHSMAGGCLAIRGTVQEGQRLKVLECDGDSSKQRWMFHGDGLSLEDHGELCVAPHGSTAIKNRDPVLLLNCDHNSTSFNY